MVKIIIREALKANEEIHMEPTLKGITTLEANEDNLLLNFNDQIRSKHIPTKTTRLSTGNYSARSLLRYGRCC